MAAAERSVVERELASKSQLDWRDVEALSLLGTPDALKRIAEAALKQPDHGGAAAVKAEAAEGWKPGLEDRFLDLLSSAHLMETSFDRLFEVAERHPTPRVVERLIYLATVGADGERYAFGAFLNYLYGHADDWYGLDQDVRPYLLKLSGTPAEQAESRIWLLSRVSRAIRATRGVLG